MKEKVAAAAQVGNKKDLVASILWRETKSTVLSEGDLES